MKKFIEEEAEFMDEAFRCYVLLSIINNIIAKTIPAPSPTKAQFNRILSFITFLYKKYGASFHYTIKDGPSISKDFKTFTNWLQAQFDLGNYDKIMHKVLFSIDTKAIPKKYLPYPKALMLAKNKEIEQMVERYAKSNVKKCRTIYQDKNKWIIWQFTREEHELLIDSGIFTLLEYVINPWENEKIKDPEVLQKGIEALTSRDYGNNPLLHELVEKIITVMKAAIYEKKGLYFLPYPENTTPSFPLKFNPLAYKTKNK